MFANPEQDPSIELMENISLLRANRKDITQSDLSSFSSLRSYGACGPSSIASSSLTDVDLTIFTEQGRGLIDFILAFQPLKMSPCQMMYREIFESKLRQQGLYLEDQDLAHSKDGKTCFVKIHAPWETLTRIAELNRMKMPIKRTEDNVHGRSSGLVHNIFRFFSRMLQLEAPYDIRDVPPFFTLEFQRAKFRQFLMQDPNTFFSQVQRVTIVWDIIERITISHADIEAHGSQLLGGHKDSVGEKFLLKKGVYCSFYPLHDGDTFVEVGKCRKPMKLWPLRPWLAETWARPGRCFKLQPLDQIRIYFGEKIGLYFAWLGFYTAMLFPFSLVGLIVFSYGLFYLPNDASYQDICYGNISQTIICRSCGSLACQFSLLQADCLHSAATAVFNNLSTVFFSFFSALWAVLFLELWKRKQARLTCKWDTFDVSYNCEQARPEYVAQAKTRRRNPITMEWEPHIPARSRIQHLITSIASVTFLICVVIAVVMGILIYKVIMVSLYNQMRIPTIKAIGSEMFTTITASFINVILIMVLEKMYSAIAWKLTINEFPRTDTDFETSYMYKMYIFQFINYYATLFYLAFFTNIMSGTPKYDTLLTDRCPPTGCMFAVTTQLATILIVKQTISNVSEIGIPMMGNWLRRRGNEKSTDINYYTRCEKDFNLVPTGELPLFGEYFEMVMQFGFVTMFVSAFPLAPFFALINNIVEIRLDAYKFLSESRRPLPIRAANIGNWYNILEFVSRMSVLTNALMIAFTTDLIERIVYMTTFSKDGSLTGYMNWTLSVFNTSDWTDSALAYDEQFGHVDQCRYRGFFQPPNSSNQYWYSSDWWRVMLAKLAFILIFEHIVFLTVATLQYIVPDIPESVSLHTQRSRYLAKDTAYKNDLNRSKNVDNPPKLSQNSMHLTMPDEKPQQIQKKKSPKLTKLWLKKRKK